MTQCEPGQAEVGLIFRERKESSDFAPMPLSRSSSLEGGVRMSFSSECLTIEPSSPARDSLGSSSSSSLSFPMSTSSLKARNDSANSDRDVSLEMVTSAKCPLRRMPRQSLQSDSLLMDEPNLLFNSSGYSMDSAAFDAESLLDRMDLSPHHGGEDNAASKLMPPPTASALSSPVSNVKAESRSRVPPLPKLQDLTNIILGNSLQRVLSFPMAMHRDVPEQADSPMDFGVSSRLSSGSVDCSASPAFTRPESKRARFRVRHPSHSEQKTSPRKIEESPIMFGSSRKPCQSLSCNVSTPVKWDQAKCHTKSPFTPYAAVASPASAVTLRRHTVSEFSSPCLNNALLSTDGGDCASNLIGDMSRPYALPILPGISCADRKYINCQTLNDVVHGKYPAVSHVHIIDCRFPYEYEGGHIKGAVNLWNNKEADKYLLGDGAKSLLDKNGKPPVLIFHCEFSLQRGPEMYRFIRSIDRERAIERYPQLCYPEMYILHGGYKEFHSQFLEECYPQDYTAMCDPAYGDKFAQFSGHSCLKARKSGTSKLPRRLTLRF